MRDPREAHGPRNAASRRLREVRQRWLRGAARRRRGDCCGECCCIGQHRGGGQCGVLVRETRVVHQVVARNWRTFGIAAHPDDARAFAPVASPQPRLHKQQLDFVSFIVVSRRNTFAGVNAPSAMRVPWRNAGMPIAPITSEIHWGEPIMRVLVVDDSSERTEVLRQGLEQAGYEVVAALTSPLELLRAVEQFKPDAIIIDTESPSRDVLEHVVMISRDEPRPIVMFASDAAPDTIREAVRAGVSAYIVDGLEASRVKTIVEVAVARFDEYQSLKIELADA